MPVKHRTPSASSQDDAFTTFALSRIKPRGATYFLDARHERFAGVEEALRDRPTVRCPYDPAWPARGRPAASEEEAREWVRHHYVPRIRRVLDAVRSSPDAARTIWEQALRGLIASYTEDPKPGDGRVEPYVPPAKRSRVSLIENHLLPTLGGELMVTTDRERAGQVIEGIQVRDRRAGTGTKPASTGTKRNAKAALAAAWNLIFPYLPAPFAGVPIQTPETEHGGLSDEVQGFEDEDALLGDEKNGALTPADLKRVLVAAMYYDQVMLARPNLTGAMIPNTAHAIAKQVGLGPRLSEELNVRWGHIYDSKNAVVIHNAKVKQVRVRKRLVPLQATLRPWLDELRAMEPGGRPHHNAFVIRSDPNAGVFQRAAQNTIARRMAMALKLAGVKLPGKASHGFRATHATYGDAHPDVDKKMLQRYLGHHAVYGASTDEYIRQMAALMTEAHRHYIQLPTPDEIRAALATFEPAPVEGWEDPRRPRPGKSQSRAEDAGDAPLAVHDERNGESGPRAVVSEASHSSRTVAARSLSPTHVGGPQAREGGEGGKRGRFPGAVGGRRSLGETQTSGAPPHDARPAARRGADAPAPTPASPGAGGRGRVAQPPYQSSTTPHRTNPLSRPAATG